MKDKSVELRPFVRVTSETLMTMHGHLGFHSLRRLGLLVFLAIDKSNTHLILSYKREADLAGTIGTAPSPGNWGCYYVHWPSNPLIHSLLPLFRMEVDRGGQGPCLLAECFSLRFHLLKKSSNLAVETDIFINLDRFCLE